MNEMCERRTVSCRFGGTVATQNEHSAVIGSRSEDQLRGDSVIVGDD